VFGRLDQSGALLFLLSRMEATLPSSGLFFFAATFVLF
jgi:hypothetical protein